MFHKQKQLFNAIAQSHSYSATLISAQNHTTKPFSMYQDLITSSHLSVSVYQSRCTGILFQACTPARSRSVVPSVHIDV